MRLDRKNSINKLCVLPRKTSYFCIYSIKCLVDIAFQMTSKYNIFNNILHRILAKMNLKAYFSLKFSQKKNNLKCWDAYL